MTIRCNRLVNLSILLLSVVIFLFIADIMLGIFGFPREKEYYFPTPNQTKVKKYLEFEFDYKTNSKGLRYRELPIKKPENEIRIFVAGDSFTEGFGVSSKQSFSALLEKKFSRPELTINFINGGLGGASPATYGRLFLNIGMTYQPDGLLVCFYANDLADTKINTTINDLYPKHFFRSGIKRLSHSLYPRIYTIIRQLYGQYSLRKQPDTDDLVERISRIALERGVCQKEIDSWKKSLPPYLVSAANRREFIQAKLALGLLVPHYWNDSLDLDSSQAKLKWKGVDIILSHILSESRQQSIKVAIIFIPCQLQYDSILYGTEIPRVFPWRKLGVEIEEKWLEGKSEIEKKLKAWADRNQVPFLNLTPFFREEVRRGVNLNYNLDGHWNAQGHKFAAGIISNWISQENIFNFTGSTPPQLETETN